MTNAPLPWAVRKRYSEIAEIVDACGGVVLLCAHDIANTIVEAVNRTRGHQDVPADINLSSRKT